MISSHEFEQEIVKAERPFDTTMNEGEIHFYDLNYLTKSEKAEVLVAEINNEIIGSGYAIIKQETESYVRHSNSAIWDLCM